MQINNLNKQIKLIPLPLRKNCDIQCKVSNLTLSRVLKFSFIVVKYIG